MLFLHKIKWKLQKSNKTEGKTMENACYFVIFLVKSKLAKKTHDMDLKIECLKKVIFKVEVFGGKTKGM